MTEAPSGRGVGGRPSVRPRERQSEQRGKPGTCSRVLLAKKAVAGSLPKCSTQRSVVASLANFRVAGVLCGKKNVRVRTGQYSVHKCVLTRSASANFAAQSLESDFQRE